MFVLFTLPLAILKCYLKNIFFNAQTQKFKENMHCIDTWYSKLGLRLTPNSLIVLASVGMGIKKDNLNDGYTKTTFGSKTSIV